MRAIARYAPAIVAAGVIAVLTVSPSIRTPTTLGVFCVLCGTRGLADLALNILLFLPLGFTLARLGWTTRKVLLACILFSACIELLQLALPGRTPSVRDVLVNGLGGWLGALIIAYAPTWARRSRQSAPAFLTVVVLAILTVATTGWLLSTAPRGDQPIYGQWDPQFANMAHWGGQIRSVQRSGEPIPSRRLPPTPPALESAPITGPITISAVLGDPPPSLAPIFGIADITGDHLLLVGQDRSDVVIRIRRRSALIRLNSPDVRFPNALADVSPGSSLELEVYGLEHPVPCIIVNGTGTCSAKPAAGRAWALFLYRSHWSPMAVSALDALLMLLLAFPVGFLALAVPRRLAVGGILALLVGIPIAAALSGLALPTFFEVFGLALGLSAGALLAKRIALPHVPLSYTPLKVTIRRST